MSDQSVELDLKFLPDWLKEAPSSNRYADFEGEAERPRRDDRRGPRPFQGGGDRRGPRPGGGGPRPGGGPGGPRGDQRRDDRRGPGSGPGGFNKDRRGPGGGGGYRGPKPGGGYQQDRREEFRGPRPPEEPRKTVVKAEMLPEPAAAVGISKQIKGSGRACGVFRVAKMFLDRPERYRVRVTALDPNGVLFQIGDGPVAFDRATVERGAFRANLDRYYTVETVQSEPPKGNFTSVARHRFSGVLLGPSSHHGYQVAIRKLYEERFSRRMSFQDFQREIETVNDPAAVEQWKQQASSTTVFKTKVEEGQEPTVLSNAAEAEQHFRTTYLPQLVKSAHSLEMAGGAAHVTLDRNITHTVRDLIERERRVPVGLVNALRPYFSEAGLHLFKWKRKILFASAIRPQRHPAEQSFGEGISAILTTVSEKPGIKRPELAQRILGQLPADAPEAAARKESLAADLHYLIHIGYVVEFQNGCLELPPAKKEAAAQHAEEHKMDVAAEMAELHEGAESAPAQKQAPVAVAEAAPAESAESAEAPESEATEAPSAEEGQASEANEGEPQGNA